MFIFSLAYLVLTIIRPQDYMPALAGIPLLPVVLLLAFLCWLGSNAKNFAAPQFLLLPIFLLALMVSEISNGWNGGALEQLATFGPIVIAFFVLANAMTSRRRVMLTLAVFTVCAMVLAMHGVEQIRTGIGWTGMVPSEDNRIQYVGIFNDPNDLGLLFAVTLPMAFYLSKHGGFLGRLFWLAGAALLLYGIYLTNSRGAGLAVLAMAAVYLWQRRGVATALVLGSAGLVGMMMMPSRMQDISVDEDSAFGRVDAWYEGMHMFLSHPLFGIGAGNFTDYNDITAHNSFVLVLAETGLFGYITWLAFVGYGFWMMLTILRHRPDDAAGETAGQAWKDERGLALTLLLAQCGFFAAAFFLSRSYIVVLYLLAAVVVGHYLEVRQRHPALPAFGLSEGWLRWVPVSLGSIAGLFVVVAVLLHSA